MKRLICLILLAFTFTGCSYYASYRFQQACESGLVETLLTMFQNTEEYTNAVQRFYLSQESLFIVKESDREMRSLVLEQSEQAYWDAFDTSSFFETRSRERQTAFDEAVKTARRDPLTAVENYFIASDFAELKAVAAGAESAIAAEDSVKAFYEKSREAARKALEEAEEDAELAYMLLGEAGGVARSTVNNPGYNIGNSGFWATMYRGAQRSLGAAGNMSRAASGFRFYVDNNCLIDDDGFPEDECIQDRESTREEYIAAVEEYEASKYWEYKGERYIYTETLGNLCD